MITAESIIGADHLYSDDIWHEAPTCPVDWRWRRAEWRLLSRSRFRLADDDDWIRRATRGQRSIERERFTDDPDLVRAWELSQPDDWTKAELEARILANQPFSDISEAMQIPATVVEAYEALFFDVLRRARGWIIHFVLGERTWEELKPEDAKWLWRYLGFACGRFAVDQIVKGVDRDKLESIGVPAYWGEDSKVSKEMQFMLISRAIPDSGIRTLKSLDRFIGAGLCEGAPIESPPEDLSLTTCSENVWGDVLVPARPKQPKSRVSRVA